MSRFSRIFLAVLITSYVGQACIKEVTSTEQALQVSPVTGEALA